MSHRYLCIYRKEIEVLSQQNAALAASNKLLSMQASAIKKQVATPVTATPAVAPAAPRRLNTSVPKNNGGNRKEEKKKEQSVTDSEPVKEKRRASKVFDTLARRKLNKPVVSIFCCATNIIMLSE